MAFTDPVPTSPADETRVNPRGTPTRVRVSTPPVGANGGAEEVVFAVDAGGADLFRVYRDGSLSLSYLADLAAGGSGTVSAAAQSSAITCGTSGSCTIVCLGQTVTYTGNADAATSVTAAKAAIAANATLAALLVTSGTTTLTLTGAANTGVLGNQFTVSVTGTGAAVASAAFTGGAGANATLNAASGRVVFGGSQAVYSILDSSVDANSIMTPVVETVGQNLALGVLPLLGGFLLVNPTTPAQITVAFSILSS